MSIYTFHSEVDSTCYETYGGKKDRKANEWTDKTTEINQSSQHPYLSYFYLQGRE